MSFAVFFLFLSRTFAATTVGPLAPISIHSLQAYATARPCAASCIVYQGIWGCGFNGGYHDLGKDLGCGCSPLNACFCSAGLQSSATSYISSCVSAGCKALGSIDGDIKSMLDLSRGYCATANVEASSKPVETGGAITSSSAQATTTRARTGNVGVSSPTASGGISESTATPEKEKEPDEGLSKSDIIALATALGVGLPSLAIGALALWFNFAEDEPQQRGRILLSTLHLPRVRYISYRNQHHTSPSLIRTSLEIVVGKDNNGDNCRHGV